MQPALGGARAPRKNIEDQLRAVDDLDVNSAFKVPLLRGRKLVVDNQNIRLVRFREILQLLDLAITKQRGRVGRRPNLKYFSHDLRAGAGSQFGQFTERFGGGR